MFIEVHGFLTCSAKSEMLSISLFAEMIRGDRVAINISPLCGDNSVHILQRTNRKDFLRQSRMRNLADSKAKVALRFTITR